MLKQHHLQAVAQSPSPTLTPTTGQHSSPNSTKPELPEDGPIPSSRSQGHEKMPTFNLEKSASSSSQVNSHKVGNVYGNSFQKRLQQYKNQQTSTNSK